MTSFEEIIQRVLSQYRKIGLLNRCSWNAELPTKIIDADIARVDNNIFVCIDEVLVFR